jgi:hypothetical protein
MNRWAIVGCPGGTNANGQAIGLFTEEPHDRKATAGSPLQGADLATPLHRDLEALVAAVNALAEDAKPTA